MLFFPSRLIRVENYLLFYYYYQFEYSSGRAQLTQVNQKLYIDTLALQSVDGYFTGPEVVHAFRARDRGHEGLHRLVDTDQHVVHAQLPLLFYPGHVIYRLFCNRKQSIKQKNIGKWEIGIDL